MDEEIVIEETIRILEPGQKSDRTMTSRHACTAVSVVMDVGLWITLMLLTLLLSYNYVGIKPTQRGFFCTDETIRYPFREDTVSDTMAVLSSVGIPVLIIMVIEAVHAIQSKKAECLSRRVQSWNYIVTLYRAIGSFLTGCVSMLLLVEVLKLSAGRLRPNFISVCDPDFSKINCSHGYVMQTEDYCRNTDEKKLIDSRKSFPSGHAGLAMYFSVYLVVYLQVRFVWRKVALLVPVLQLTDMCWGAFVCVSRVSDNRHHYSDVIGGAIIGGGVALFTIKYLSYLPRMARKRQALIPEVTLTNGVTPKSRASNAGDSVVEMAHIGNSSTKISDYPNST